MNFKLCFRTAGTVLLILSALLMLPLLCGLIYHESIWNFVVTAALCAGLGLLFRLIKPSSNEMFAREGFFTVGISWTIMSLLGALPLFISGEIPNYASSFFETVSGFTTTGSSIVTDVESLSKCGAFWRMFTHWIGGMGMLVFMMAIQPKSRENSMHVMRAEVPGPSVGKLVPKISSTARILYLIYIGITLLETILLMLGGMNFYEAILHSFSTVGTGGFSTRGDAIAGFHSAYIEYVIAIFMLVCAVNFNLYFLALTGRFKIAVKSEELHVFLALVLGVTLIIALGIVKIYGSFSEAFRIALFQVAAIISTTGFSNRNFLAWPGYTKSIIVMLMFIGGCAGSTGGGMKLSRVMIVVKGVIADLKAILSPRSVAPVRLEGKRLDKSSVQAAYTYFILYMLLILVTGLLISVDGFDSQINYSAALTAMSNVGPGLADMIGPMGNFAAFSSFSKVVLAFCMLFGRLEIYAMIILFSPRTWKNIKR